MDNDDFHVSPLAHLIHIIKRQEHHLVFLPFSISFLPKASIHQFLQSSILGSFRGVGLDEVVGFSLQLLVEAEDIIGGDEIDNPRGRYAIDLVLQNVPDTRLVVREGCLDGLAAVEAFDDLRDV